MYKRLIKLVLLLYMTLILVLRRVNLFLLLELVVVVSLHLLRCYIEKKKPDKGSIIIGGIDVAKLKNRKVYILRRKLGVVFQDFKLLPKLTVYENVAFAMEVLGYDKKKSIKG